MDSKKNKIMLIFLILLIYSGFGVINALLIHVSNVDIIHSLFNFSDHTYIKHYNYYYYSGLIRLILNVISFIILCVTSVSFLIYRKYKMGVLIVFFIWITSGLISFVFNYLIYKLGLGFTKEFLLYNIISWFLMTITFILIYFRITKFKFGNASFVLLFILNLSGVLYNAMLNRFELGNYLRHNETIFSINILVNNIIMWIMLTILILFLLLFIKRSSLNSFFKLTIFTMYLCVCFYLLFDTLHTFSNYSIELEPQNSNYLFVLLFKRGLLLIPSYVLFFIPLLMLEPKNILEERKGKYFMTGFMILIISWLGFNLKTNYFIEDEFLLIENINEITLKYQKELDGKEYVLYAAKERENWTYYGLDLKQTNWLGFKEYHHIAAQTNYSSKLSVTKVCEESCQIYVFGYNENLYHQVTINLDPNKTIILVLNPEWNIHVIELDEQYKNSSLPNYQFE